MSFPHRRSDAQSQTTLDDTLFVGELINDDGDVVDGGAAEVADQTDALRINPMVINLVTKETAKRKARTEAKMKEGAMGIYHVIKAFFCTVL